MSEDTSTHDATPSWSGYIYQGKIAIFHALRVLREKFSHDAESSFDDFCLEIEWEQDFSIKNGSLYDSIHQVKAYSDSRYTKLKEAIDGENGLKKSLEAHITSKGYIHVWQQITFNNGKKCEDYREKIFKKYLGAESNLLDRIEIYRYPNSDAFCDLENISLLIENEIKEIVNLGQAFSAVPKTPEQYERSRLALYSLLDQKVSYAHKLHKSRSANGNCNICFNDVIQILNKAYDKQSEELLWADLKDFFFQRIADFCSSSSYCNLDVCVESCLIRNFVVHLEEMNQEEFANFVCEISPHKDFNKRNVFEKSISPSDLKSSLLKSYFTCQSLQSDEFKCFYTLEKLALMPTTIGDDQDEAQSVAKNILQNRAIENLKALYQADCLISRRINIDKLKEAAIDPKNFSEDEVERMFEKAKFPEKAHHIKNLKIKSIDRIKEELE